ncbi:unnamed protein product [Ixodes persulcatus]
MHHNNDGGPTHLEEGFKYAHSLRTVRSRRGQPAAAANDWWSGGHSSPSAAEDSRRGKAARDAGYLLPRLPLRPGMRVPPPPSPSFSAYLPALLQSLLLRRGPRFEGKQEIEVTTAKSGSRGAE